MRTSKHSENSSAFFLRKKKFEKTDSRVKSRIYAGHNSRVTPARARARAFCSGNFCSTHYPDRQRVGGVAHVSAARYKKAACQIRVREKKARNKTAGIPCTRARAAARRRVGWIFRGNPLPLTVSSPFRARARSLEIA